MESRAWGWVKGQQSHTRAIGRFRNRVLETIQGQDSGVRCQAPPIQGAIHRAQSQTRVRSQEQNQSPEISQKLGELPQENYWLTCRANAPDGVK